MTEAKRRSERGRTEGTGTSEGRKREGKEGQRGVRKAQKGRREPEGREGEED